MEYGEIRDLDETYHGTPFFRKVFWYPDESNIASNASINEQAIVKILMKHPHPNIVSFYNVNTSYVDMEVLDTENINLEEAITSMENVKRFLQSLGIIYMDWKIDNVGKGKDGKYKLFDFDGSGLMDIKTREWINIPVHFFAFRKAKELNIEDPIDMDDWAFNKYLLRE